MGLPLEPILSTCATDVRAKSIIDCYFPKMKLIYRTLYGQRAAIVDFGWKLSQRACVRWFCVRAAATPIQLALVQPVLITRSALTFVVTAFHWLMQQNNVVRALYNCNRFVTGILLLIYAGTLVNLIVFASAILPGVITDYTCFPPENNKRLEVFYSATMYVH